MCRFLVTVLLFVAGFDIPPKINITKKSAAIFHGALCIKRELHGNNPNDYSYRRERHAVQQG